MATKTRSALEQARRSRRLSRYAVANATGVPYTTLRRLEAGGERAVLQHLAALARFYQVPLEALL